MKKRIYKHTKNDKKAASNSKPSLQPVLALNKKEAPTASRDQLEESDIGICVCDCCKKLCNILNLPKKITCDRIEHCVCELCIQANSKYDKGLKFTCPLHSKERTYPLMYTEAEYNNSFKTLLVRPIIPNDEAYELAKHLFSEEMLLSAQKLIKANPQIRDTSLVCPQCKQLYSAKCTPVRLPCYHSVCELCFQLGFDSTNNAAFCSVEKLSLAITSLVSDCATYLRCQEYQELMDYATDWNSVESKPYMGKIIEVQDEDRNECTICYSTYNCELNAKVDLHIPANHQAHSICKQCLSDIVERNLDKKLIKCPQCNHEIQVSGSKEEALAQFINRKQ